MCQDFAKTFYLFQVISLGSAGYFIITPLFPFSKCNYLKWKKNEKKNIGNLGINLHVHTVRGDTFVFCRGQLIDKSIIWKKRKIRGRKWAVIITKWDLVQMSLTLLKNLCFCRVEKWHMH